jgi:23S rRNA pseudouridine1911/1915/1917 synthase
LAWVDRQAQYPLAACGSDLVSRCVKAQPAMPSASSELKVIFEDNHLLVIDKPPLLATMGTQEGEDSLVERARQYLKGKYNKPGNVFIGVVSRLDSFVTGVVVLARTSKAASRLSEQFRSRTVEKKYWAIIPDGLPSDSGQLEDRLIKNESRHRMEVLRKNAPKHPNEKLARLRYRTIGRFSPINGERIRLIEVELETGRKHQIRVQFENVNCPIIGDQKYGSDLPFKRGIALHSRELVIKHPTKQVSQSFQSDPPGWWNTGRFTL